MAEKSAPVAAEKPDFKYIVRIANTDLNGKHHVELALATVKGIGIRTAGVIADRAGVRRLEKLGNLQDADIAKLEEAVDSFVETAPRWLLNRALDVEIGSSMHLVGADLEGKRRDDINRMKKIRSYKGVRHEDGQKVRGQRSKSNGRTGLTVGVQRKAIQQAAAGKKDDDKGAKKEAKKPDGKKPEAKKAEAKK
ncbi:MAG: 30S ribosomal protein S13 [Euryarchaeota archaeon]|nr:30S ribosomal protein S13 [Euryarchaeota archaeon]